MRFAPGAIGFEQMQRARLEASALAQTIVAGTSAFLSMNMGTCVRNDIILMSLFIQGTKGAAAGMVGINVSKNGASTGSLEWDGANDSNTFQLNYNAADFVSMFQTRIGRVTVGGTIILDTSAFSAGSNVTGADFYAQAWILRGE